MSNDPITSLLKESRTFAPPAQFAQQARIGTREASGARGAWRVPS